MSHCIDLKALFGRDYQVTYEESYRAERGKCGRGHDPWLLVMPCRHGHIYPHGEDYLAASTNHRGRVARRLAALPFVRIVQDGSDGINVEFHSDDFDQVAAVMKPKRRRRLTDNQRADQVERLRDFQFRPAAHDAGNGRRRDPTTRVESQAV